jgi:hypothetical protein
LTWQVTCAARVPLLSVLVYWTGVGHVIGSTCKSLELFKKWLRLNKKFGNARADELIE